MSQHAGMTCSRQEAILAASKLSIMVAGVTDRVSSCAGCNSHQAYTIYGHSWFCTGRRKLCDRRHKFWNTLPPARPSHLQRLLASWRVVVTQHCEGCHAVSHVRGLTEPAAAEEGLAVRYTEQLMTRTTRMTADVTPGNSSGCATPVPGATLVMMCMYRWRRACIPKHHP
jgi:hypothetical protein